MEIQSFFAGHPTYVCVLNLSHKFITALDQPDAEDISHIIIFDSQYHPLSLLNINCDSCILAQEDQEVRRLFAESLDAGDLPFREPPPKYEVDRSLPDYHEQDQERGQSDRPRQRMDEPQARSEQQDSPRRTVFHEIFDDAPALPTADEILIDLSESETSDEDLIELSSMDETASTVMARDFAYSSMDETTTVAMLNRIYPALIPKQNPRHLASRQSWDDGRFGATAYIIHLVTMKVYRGRLVIL